MRARSRHSPWAQAKSDSATSIATRSAYARLCSNFPLFESVKTGRWPVRQELASVAWSESGPS